jgi:hypothetical protein
MSKCLISDFFSPPPKKRGRPKGSTSKTAARKSKKHAKVGRDEVLQRKAPVPVQLAINGVCHPAAQTLSRINYNKEPHRGMMEAAVAEWFNEKKGTMSLAKYAALAKHNMPPKSIMKYCHGVCPMNHQFDWVSASSQRTMQ